MSECCAKVSAPLLECSTFIQRKK